MHKISFKTGNEREQKNSTQNCTISHHGEAIFISFTYQENNCFNFVKKKVKIFFGDIFLHQIKMRNLQNMSAEVNYANISSLSQYTNIFISFFINIFENCHLSTIIGQVSEIP